MKDEAAFDISRPPVGRPFLGTAAEGHIESRRSARWGKSSNGGCRRSGWRALHDPSRACSPARPCCYAGAIDTGSVGDARLVSGLAAHVLIKAIVVTQPDAAVTALVVGKDSSIHTVADLKGHSLETLRGQTGHFLTLAAIERAGLPLDSVKFVFLTPMEAKAALTGGSVDRWATWGPYISLAEIRDGARVADFLITTKVLPQPVGRPQHRPLVQRGSVQTVGIQARSSPDAEPTSRLSGNTRARASSPRPRCWPSRPLATPRRSQVGCRSRFSNNRSCARPGQFA